MSRINTYQLTSQKETASRLVQGGQHSQIIRLTKPDSITLSYLDILPLSLISTNRSDYFTSSFTSSNSTLNKIWDIGARIIELDTLSTHSLSITWTVTPQGLMVKDSALSVYWASTKRSEYTVKFDVQILENEVGWMVGANPMGEGISVCTYCKQ